jgi:hypothetical protein
MTRLTDSSKQISLGSRQVASLGPAMPVRRGTAVPVDAFVSGTQAAASSFGSLHRVDG